MSLVGRLRREVRRIKAGRAADLVRWRTDPVGYCGAVLGVRLTPAQEQIARLLLVPPYRVLVRAGHNVGKSFLSACLVSWWYDTRNPGICLTTAPTDRQVKDILWKEVRRLRSSADLGGWVGPRAPRLEDAPDHFAHGFTARDGDRFQGHHSSDVMIVFDEAEGVEPIFWEAAETMLGEQSPMLALYNPTQQSGPTVDAERSGRWHLVSMSSVDHPNIAAELAGGKPLYPSAIRLGRLREMLAAWAMPIQHGERTPEDISLGGEWWRPGPVAEARLLGRRPSSAFNSVWPAAVFDLCERVPAINGGPLQVGCDVARYGDDFTAFHVRRGGVSLAHETHNGWSVPMVAQRARSLAEEWAKRLNFDPRKVPIAVDDCGVGGGVTDMLAQVRMMVAPMNGAWTAPDENQFPNLRSALWFDVEHAARRGLVCFSQLPFNVRAELRRQCTAPLYTLDKRGRRTVEQKEATKQRIGRSPDDADAMLLAYADVGIGMERVAGRVAA